MKLREDVVDGNQAIVDIKTIRQGITAAIELNDTRCLVKSLLCVDRLDNYFHNMMDVEDEDQKES